MKIIYNDLDVLECNKTLTNNKLVRISCKLWLEWKETKQCCHTDGFFPNNNNRGDLNTLK